MIRALFTGSRHWTDLWAIVAVVEALPADAVVIEGGAKGADALAAHAARSRGLRVETFPAKWTEHAEPWCKCGANKRQACNGAGRRRNQQMLDEGRPTEAHAFPLPQSRGTWDMVRRCEKAGVPVTIHAGGQDERR